MRINKNNKLADIINTSKNESIKKQEKLKIKKEKQNLNFREITFQKIFTYFNIILTFSFLLLIIHGGYNLIWKKINPFSEYLISIIFKYFFIPIILSTATIIISSLFPKK